MADHELLPVMVEFSAIHHVLVCCVVLASCVTGSVTDALPQFSLLSGNKCVMCHYSAGGGGVRTARGWREYRDVGIWNPGEGTAGKILGSARNRNALFDNRLILGGDLRFQSSRQHISDDADRDNFTMQAALYSALNISRNLDLEASYNFAESELFGQEEWTASVIVHPRFSFTRIRIGHFHPSIGIRYDDHTFLVRTVAGANGTSLIPPLFAEYGAELTINTYPWLQLTAGVYDAENMAENIVVNETGETVSLIEDPDRPSYLGRVEFRSRFRDAVNMYEGASVYANGDFAMVNLFAGAGIGERLTVMGEYAWSEREDLRDTKNFSFEADYRIIAPLIVYVRGEHGVTEYDYERNGIDRYSNAGVFGAQVFVAPGIVFRPEYRLLDTQDYRSTRYAVQLQLFQ